MIVVNTPEFEFREATVFRSVAAGEWICDITDRAAGESAMTVGEEDVIIGEGSGENKGGENGGEEESGGGGSAVGGGRIGERHFKCNGRMMSVSVAGIIVEREFERC